MTDRDFEGSLEPIAIVGMACRVPGAANLDEFWQNLADGVESIRDLTEEEMLAAGAGAKRIRTPGYVARAPVLDGVEEFDAGRFGFTRREAEILDPQHRLLLECAAAALDHAGYDPARYDGDIGVYAGAGAGEYQWYHLIPNKPLLNAVGQMAVALANNPDYLSTLVSYKLNLRGPSVSVHTACSTGLVAIHLACEAVRNGECDMALAGAASIELTQHHGYQYHEGGILSPDGHCRTFDADAQGTLWGSGGGIVVLKRLSDALEDGDTVHGLILGSAINNDGADKVGFSAPSVAGQAEVISQALDVAGVDAATIDYVEAHGTATSIGDPIEVTALTQAFRRSTQERTPCGLGSVKPNIGHLAAAAGVIGLIKTVLALQHETLPRTLHFTRPHPKIDFEGSPFRVVAETEPWPRGDAPRRAGVSSFGMGGTNAHAIVEEAPRQPAAAPAAGPHAIVLSARTSPALDTAAAELAEHLRRTPDADLGAVAHTLQHGRAAREFRRAVVCADAQDAAHVLSGGAPRRVIAGRAGAGRQVVFMLPGQGAQRVGMAQGLYEREPVVRAAIDRCADALRPVLGVDLRDVLFAEDAADRLDDTALTQPALFAVEYALARLWLARGVRPDALIGHSLGEYVAACLAGVFDLETGLRLVAARGRLMGACAPGAMLAVQYEEEGLGDLTARGLSLAAVNGPGACVVSGPADALAAYAAELDEVGMPNTVLRTSHAFHSTMMEPARAAFAGVLAGEDLRAPAIPILSNVTGEWLTSAQATSPDYWTSHMCLPVRFGPGLAQVMREAPSVLLEVGPGAVLTGLARLQLTPDTPDPVATLPRDEDEPTALLSATARLWTLGVPVDWSAAAGDASPRRVALPAQPFERERYWIEELPPAAAAAPEAREDKLALEEWFWVPGWRQAPRPQPAADAQGPWLVFRDEEGVADGLVERLRARGERVVTVSAGSLPARPDADAHMIRAAEAADYDALLDALGEDLPERIVHAWALRREAAPSLDVAAAERTIERGFTSLLCLAQALAARGLAEGRRLDVLTADSQDVTGGDLLSPAQATVTGPCRTFGLEFPGLVCRHVDVALAGGPAADALVSELTGAQDPVVALRAGKRWLPTLEPTRLEEAAAERATLRPGGVYLITGGLGGIGLSLGEALARRVRARLVLVGRSPLPPRAEWAQHAQGADRLARRLRRLLALEDLGAELLVLDADVTSAADMARVRDAAVRRFGAVHGVVHAAGVAGGTLVEAHAPDVAAGVLAPKVAGTLVLAQVFDDTALDFLVLCSSVTAVAGAIGQVDYCAGNAFMDAFARARAAAGAPVVSVNWGGWLEVGMAVETDAPAGFRDIQRGLRRLAIEHPLLDGAVGSEDGHTVTATATLGPQTHWALDEHRIHGTAVLPGTGYLEMVRAAFDREGDGRPVVLRDVVFLAPLGVADGEGKEVRVVIEDADDGAGFRVESASGGAWRTHARGSVGWGESGPAPVHDLEAIRARCPRRREDAGVQASASGMLAFGPRWSSLTRASAGDGEELALLEAGPQVAAELPRYGLHPALLDEATAFGEFGGAEGRYLPLGYGRLEVRAALPPRLFSHLRHRDGDAGGLLVCDIALLDETGAEVAAIRDFMLRQVDAGEIETSLAPDAPPATPAADDDEVGIRPHEGAEALLRVLGAQPGPQVVVSALDMPTLIASVAKVDRDRLAAGLPGAAGGGVALEVLEGDYVEPESELERELVRLWEEATGTRGIGIEHDFFEIGGNSLVAVQLMSRVRTTFGVKLPMRSLFEAPTIRAMAAAVEAGAELVA